MHTDSSCIQSFPVMEAAELLWQEKQWPTSCQVKTQHSSWQKAQAACEDTVQWLRWVKLSLSLFFSTYNWRNGLNAQDLFDKDSAKFYSRCSCTLTQKWTGVRLTKAFTLTANSGLNKPWPIFHKTETAFQQSGWVTCSTVSSTIHFLHKYRQRGHGCFLRWLQQHICILLEWPPPHVSKRSWEYRFSFYPWRPTCVGTSF